MNALSRRTALTVFGGATALLAATPALAKASRTKIDVSTPQGRLKAYMLMRGALDDRLVIGCISGTYYGVVDAEITPLYGVVAATFARYRPHAAGGYEAVTTEQAYFTDLETGAWIKSYKNPYTGETVTVPASGFKPNRIIISPDVDLRLATPVPGIQFDHHVLPVEIRGDDVWLTEVTRTAGAVPGSAKPFRYSESVVLHARRSELEARNAKQVTCETTFNGVVSWRPWLKMGDRPGHLLGIGAGRYGATMETLPAVWISATREHRPDLLSNPIAVLDPLWKASA